MVGIVNGNSIEQDQISRRVASTNRVQRRERVSRFNSGQEFDGLEDIAMCRWYVLNVVRCHLQLRSFDLPIANSIGMRANNCNIMKRNYIEAELGFGQYNAFVFYMYFPFELFVAQIRE